MKKVRRCPLVDQLTFVVKAQDLAGQVLGPGSIATGQRLDDLGVAAGGIAAESLAEVTDVQRDGVRLIFGGIFSHRVMTGNRDGRSGNRSRWRGRF